MRPVIPSHQHPAPVPIRAQTKLKASKTQGIEATLKGTLEGDEGFQKHKDECTMKEGLAWTGAKVYIPKSQRVLILEKSYDSKLQDILGW